MRAGEICVRGGTMSGYTILLKGTRILFFHLLLLAFLFVALFGQTYTSAGSGFIVTNDGYILTNHHVVEGAAGPIIVVLQDGTEYEATLIDYSPTMDDGGCDIALLKIDASRLPTLSIGDSDLVQLFNQVIAMGYPLSFSLGVNLNVTGGNVTAFRDFEDAPELFQIDAAINPGNSGGPVLNEKGQVIGIATSRITQIADTQVQGVSFAVPINYANELLKQNIRGWMNANIKAPALSSREIVSRSTQAVVYISWSETYLYEDHYSEDFSVKRDWYANYWDDKGFIEITQSRDGYTLGVECPCDAAVPNFEVDIVFTEHTNGGAGLTILAPEGDRWHYAVVLDPDGWYAFYTRSPDGHTWKILPSGWRRSNTIKKGLRVINNLRVEVLERITRVYFNNQAAGSLNATVPLGGGVQLTVLNFEGTTTVRFDNLNIYIDKSASILD